MVYDSTRGVFGAVWICGFKNVIPINGLRRLCRVLNSFSLGGISGGGRDGRFRHLSCSIASVKMR